MLAGAGNQLPTNQIQTPMLFPVALDFAPQLLMPQNDTCEVRLQEAECLHKSYVAL